MSSCVIDRTSGIPEIQAEDLRGHEGEFTMVDVRTPEEFTGELGHIENAKLVTLGPDLENFLSTRANKDDPIAFVCRSGGRSGHATKLALDLGYKNPVNLKGGMLRWNDLKYPTSRS